LNPANQPEARILFVLLGQNQLGRKRGQSALAGLGPPILSATPPSGLMGCLASRADDHIDVFFQQWRTVHWGDCRIAAQARQTPKSNNGEVNDETVSD